MNLCKYLLALSALLVSTQASATLLEFTFTSASQGTLGSFVMDDAVFDGSSGQYVSNSNIVALDFSWGGVSYGLGDVTTYAWTIFDSSGLAPTVTGGSGGLAFNGSTGVIVYSSSLINVNSTSFADGSWSTTEYSTVPAPASLALLGMGLLLLRRRG